MVGTQSLYKTIWCHICQWDHIFQYANLIQAVNYTKRPLLSDFSSCSVSLRGSSDRLFRWCDFIMLKSWWSSEEWQLHASTALKHLHNCEVQPETRQPLFSITSKPPPLFFFCSASSQVECISEWRALRPKSDFQLLKPSDSFIWISAGGPERSNFDSNPNLRSIPLITSLLRPQTYILGAGLNKKKPTVSWILKSFVFLSGWNKI